MSGRYEGEYVDSMQTGYGLMTWADGRRYEGYWVNSKCTGFGTLTHKDGRRYEGQYVNDKMQVRAPALGECIDGMALSSPLKLVCGTVVPVDATTGARSIYMG